MNSDGKKITGVKVLNINEESAEAIAALASDGAKPLNYNHFKLPMMENLVRRAMRG